MDTSSVAAGAQSGRWRGSWTSLGKLDIHGGRMDVLHQQGSQGKDVGVVHDYVLVDMESEVQVRFRE